MKNTYNEIRSILGSKGEKLGMSAGSINYTATSDPRPSTPGYTTSGTNETINIPDEYMAKSGANNSREFLDWLRKQ